MHHGAVELTHLASYLSELVLRFDRRKSWALGIVFFRVLEFAVAHVPEPATT